MLELCVGIFLYLNAYAGLGPADTGARGGSYVDAQSYLSVARSYQDGTAFDPEIAPKLLDRVRRPPGYPAFIIAASRLLGGEVPQAIATAHLIAGASALFLIWLLCAELRLPGALLLGLAWGGFFQKQDAFSGALPEWLTMLSVVAVPFLVMRVFRRPTFSSEAALVLLSTWLILLKAAFIAFLFAAIAVVSKNRNRRLGTKLAITIAGILPLIFWMAVNYHSLGTPSPSVDLGFNLFGSTALLPWPEQMAVSQSGIIPEFIAALEQKRLRASEPLLGFLDSQAHFVGQAGPQDFNIWQVAVPACEIFRYSSLECEGILRRISFSTIAANPAAFASYVTAQFSLKENRAALEFTAAIALIGLILFTLRERFPRSRSLIASLNYLSCCTLITALAHAAGARLGLRYLFPCLVSQSIFFAVVVLVCAAEVITRIFLSPVRNDEG